MHANGDNNATLLARNVILGDQTRPTAVKSAHLSVGESGRFGNGHPGSCSVRDLGNHPVTKQKGCGPSGEHNLQVVERKAASFVRHYAPGNGVKPAYVTDGVFRGSLSVPSGLLITRFDSREPILIHSRVFSGSPSNVPGLQAASIPRISN